LQQRVKGLEIKYDKAMKLNEQRITLKDDELIELRMKKNTDFNDRSLALSSKLSKKDEEIIRMSQEIRVYKE